MITQRLDENHVMNKFFKCDCCGKELNMGYFPSPYPPKPWKHKEVKKEGFYLLQHFCKNCH